MARTSCMARAVTTRSGDSKMTTLNTAALVRTAFGAVSGMTVSRKGLDKQAPRLYNPGVYKTRDKEPSLKAVFSAVMAPTPCTAVMAMIASWAKEEQTFSAAVMVMTRSTGRETAECRT